MADSGRVRVIHGDMRDELRKLRDEGARVQSIVTDPPYHLTAQGKGGQSNLVRDPNTLPPSAGTRYTRVATGFMGKEWDGGDIAFRPETWRLCFDLLPPGGHLLAFGGTRCFHRLACAIEDAGFEIRDAIAWLYGSGFPKSHNVSKGIDRTAGVEREVIGQRQGQGSIPNDRGEWGLKSNTPVDITLPATPAARQWDGWGTALKPSLELVCVARKPLIGTVSANVLKYGTGALNIDGCRITTGQRPDEDAAWDDVQNLCDLCAERAAQNGKPSTPATRASIAARNAGQTLNGKGETRPPVTDKADIGCSDGTMAATTATSSSIDGSGPSDMDLFQQATTSTTSTVTSPTTDLKTCNVCRAPLTSQNTASSIRPNKNGLQQPPSDGASLGRWPANTVHDGSDEVVKAFPETQSGDISPYTSKSNGYEGGWGLERPSQHTGDSGSAARFFYSAKADSDDRLGSKHPTVKPVDLMRWLVRLVTPPDGTVLDPFAGSGTTGMACMAEGFDCILVEREAEYVADIEARIAHVRGDDTPLFRSAAD